MHRTRKGLSLRWLIGSIVATVAASALLVAQAVDTQPPAAPALTQPAATQPGPASQPAAAPDIDVTEAAARERVLSGLIGSKHDFTAGGRSGRDLCLTCHTPHLVSAPAPRLDRRIATAQPLRPYQGVNVELSGWSLLCLGCHDGVTATDVYSGAHAVSVAGELANPRLGVRGLRSHPVGVKYPSVAEGYQPLGAVEASGLLLPGGRIQCTTCHNAHNTDRHPHFLAISNERSRLCLTCHRL